MPSPNFNAEIILAAGIWLLAICSFATMLLIVSLKLLAENWAKLKMRPEAGLQTTGESPSPGNEDILVKEAELDSPS